MNDQVNKYFVLKTNFYFVYSLVLPSAPGELLDAYLAREAHRLNKTVGSLEPATYHCEVKFKITLFSLKKKEPIHSLIETKWGSRFINLDCNFGSC